MESTTPLRKGDSLPTTLGERRVWWLLVLALLVWQGWMTLSLFGGPRSWKRLLDDEPILSGRHPLHLYHGYLGARALREHGNLSCYDPNFHAGYPKTPVFDSGSRPAELLLTLTGSTYRPAAYKIGLALLCVVVPWLAFVAARGVGLNRAAATLACVLCLLVWWGQPCREMLEAGDLDLLLAALLALVQAGLLIRYHRDPGPLSWLGIVLASLLGWFAHPLLMILLLPLVLIYYLSVGTRHRMAWHLALWAGLVVALGVNSFWLLDWIGYWWIRVPPQLESPILAEPTLRNVWQASCWGDSVDKILACVLVMAATGGVLLYNQTGQRATARLLGLACCGFIVLAATGLIWEPLGRFGAHRLLIPALLFAAPPAAHAVSAALARVGRWRTGRWLGLCAAAVGIVVLCFAPPPALASWATRLFGTTPLQLGLSAEQKAILQQLREHTTPQARILWEDRAASPVCSHWSPLLPLLTERAFVGGLDAEAGIEHLSNGLIDGLLMGRPIRDWSDEDLHEYCHRYNVGWVACWSAAACARMQAWSPAQAIATLPPCATGKEPGCLFLVRRAHVSFALIGSAQWLHADPQRIVLGDVLPDRGGGSGQRGKNQVVLSLHYQAGMRVAPSRVHLDGYRMEHADPASDDSTPFVRLWVEEPVTRVTITWEKK